MPLYNTIPSPILNTSGTVGAPSYSFAASSGIGWYLTGATASLANGNNEWRFGQTTLNMGGAYQLKWFTGGAFSVVNVMLTPAGASTARLEVNNGTLTTYRDLIAQQLFAGGDGAAGIAGSTSLSNATDTTTTNAYTVKGGQAATTANTGWIKIYVGTAVAWIPYWQNATP